jgi:hypothetical protein
MDQPPSSPTGRQPGEALPASRRLARPPSDRYRTAAPEVVVERPDLVRATLLGLVAGAGTAIPTAILHAVLSITAGLIAISILGGWLIGVGVRTGSWSGRPHRPSRSPLVVAAALGLVTWLLGLVLAWLLSMAILPASTMSLLDRLAAIPFLDWLEPQLGPLDLLRLVLLVGVAWAAAHTSALERQAERIAQN